MPSVEVNGWTFDCEIQGQGSDIIFIHGEIHGTTYWSEQVREFSQRHRCLVYHRRGHSKTGCPEFGYSLENQRRDLEGLIEHFNVTNPIIVALAFGTTIAVDYAIHYPKSIRGLVLVAWSELHDAMKYFDRWKVASERVVKILEDGGRDALLSFLRKEGGKSIYMVIPTNSPIREECIRMLGSHPIDEYKRGMLEFATSVPNLIDAFSNLELPVLGINGELDPFPDQPERLATMSNFNEVSPISGAGRFVQWEKPAEFNAIIRKFVENIDRI